MAALLSYRTGDLQSRSRSNSRQLDMAGSWNPFVNAIIDGQLDKWTGSLRLQLGDSPNDRFCRFRLLQKVGTYQGEDYR